MARHLGLLAVLGLAAVLRLWRLDQNGYDNQYYAAAVRSMLASWHNLLYNSFDPAGFVSVDKPPVALWLQVASAKALGFQGLAVLLPQVLEGLATIALLYHLVARRFGATAGTLAALFLALTPVSVAVDRSNNTESCLVLVLLLAAWALVLAAEQGRRRLLLLAMALVGVAFNVKMLAAFVVLPTFVAVYVAGNLTAWRRRLVDLTLGGLVLVAVSLSWPLVYDLATPDARPFAGSSTRNSMLELAGGYNGLGRFVRIARPDDAGPRSGATPGGVTSSAAAEPGPQSRWARLFVRVPVGPLRLADGQLAGQAGWLLPIAVVGLVARLAGAPRRLPLAPTHLALILWTGWALTYVVVYSFAGGIFHFYYLATLGPPLAALAAIGLVALWERYRGRGPAALVLPAALLLTAAWQAYIEASAVGWVLRQPDDPWTWLHLGLLAGTLLSAGWLLVLLPGEDRGRADRVLMAGSLGVGLLALLATPAAWALSSVLERGASVLPSADLARLVTRDDLAAERARTSARDRAKLIAFLQANRQGARYLLATSTTRIAAPIIIQTGEPVMARGGFHGLDQILTPATLARLVETNQVRFVMLGDITSIDRRMGAAAAGRPVADWVRAHGTPVPSDLWRLEAGGDSDAAAGAPGRRTGGASQLYDLRPAAGLVPAG